MFQNIQNNQKNELLMPIFLLLYFSAHVNINGGIVGGNFGGRGGGVGECGNSILIFIGWHQNNKSLYFLIFFIFHNNNNTHTQHRNTSSDVLKNWQIYVEDIVCCCLKEQERWKSKEMKQKAEKKRTNANSLET